MNDPKNKKKTLEKKKEYNPSPATLRRMARRRARKEA